MSYGLKILNSFNNVQIDSDYRNFLVIEEGLRTTGNINYFDVLANGTLYSIPSTGSVHLIPNDAFLFICPSVESSTIGWVCNYLVNSEDTPNIPIGMKYCIVQAVQNLQAVPILTGYPDPIGRWCPNTGSYAVPYSTTAWLNRPYRHIRAATPNNLLSTTYDYKIARLVDISELNINTGVGLNVFRDNNTLCYSSKLPPTKVLGILQSTQSTGIEIPYSFPSESKVYYNILNSGFICDLRGATGIHRQIYSGYIKTSVNSGIITVIQGGAATGAPTYTTSTSVGASNGSVFNNHIFIK